MRGHGLRVLQRAAIAETIAEIGGDAGRTEGGMPSPRGIRLWSRFGLEKEFGSR
jgi:hypothetical protein